VEEPFLSAIDHKGVGDVRQKKIHTEEPPVLKPSTSEVEMATEELKRHKSQYN